MSTTFGSGNPPAPAQAHLPPPMETIDLCYTGTMGDNHHIWRVWARYLHRWGLRAFVASFLEALGPVTILGAQALYIGQPLLGSFFPTTHLQALAHVLEDTDERRAFITYLREAP